MTLTCMLSALASPVAIVAQQSLDRENAESRLGQVVEEISQLKSQLEASRSEHKNEQARLKQVDLAIQQANLKYRELEQQRQLHLDDLQSLEQQREEYLSSLDQRLEHLAEQLRSSYRAGKQSRMKLVLNQDDPEQLSRLLAYYDYLNRAQVKNISELKEALTRLEVMQESIDQELQRITLVQAEQQDVMTQLQEQREQREMLLADLSSQIDSENTRLQELERNRRDLEALIERLADALADIPADLGSHKGIPQQKGRLPMPVKGPVKHAFGQNRAGGLRWQGWLIGTQAGTEVKTVAYGRVAFADWLRGYGLLIIIDHGEDFLSLYGHNESLLHEAGSWVEPGDVISVVGSNPGNDQGLYFELRRKGKALDPASWLAR